MAVYKNGFAFIKSDASTIGFDISFEQTRIDYCTRVWKSEAIFQGRVRRLLLSEVNIFFLYKG